MRIRCRSNLGSELPTTLLVDRVGVRADERFPLTLGKTYTVYAFTVYLGHAWFYLVDDYEHPWPTWYPGPLLDVIDERLSKYWVIRYERHADNPITGLAEAGMTITFPEWAHEPSFLDRLTDNLEPEVTIFYKYKRLMDAEFEEDQGPGVGAGSMGG